MADAKEHALAAQQGLSRQAEAERLRIVERHSAELSAARSAQQSAEQQTAGITAQLHEASLSLRERGNRLEVLEQEVAILRRQV